MQHAPQEDGPARPGAAVSRPLEREGTDLPPELGRHPRDARPAGDAVRPGRRKAVKGQQESAVADPIDVLLATNMISVGVDVSGWG